MFIYDIVKWRRGKKSSKMWKNKGKPMPPPPIIKQRTVKRFLKQYSIQTLIETGTFYGDMVEANRKNAKKIISIELDERLYNRAKEKFSRYKHIKIINGDSGEKLQEILQTIRERCVFWLDSHYSGEGTAKGSLETPIMQEIKAILNHSIPDHVILIDDASNFIGEKDYPELEEFKQYILKMKPNLLFYVKNDIIRIHKEYE